MIECTLWRLARQSSLGFGQWSLLQSWTLRGHDFTVSHYDLKEASVRFSDYVSLEHHHPLEDL